MKNWLLIFCLFPLLSNTFALDVFLLDSEEIVIFDNLQNDSSEKEVDDKTEKESSIDFCTEKKDFYSFLQHKSSNLIDSFHMFFTSHKTDLKSPPPEVRS